MLNPIITYLTGIITAFTPCVAVLIPLIGYRLIREEEGKTRKTITLIISFIITYAIIGAGLSSILSSNIKNGFQAGLGILFITLGVLELKGRINPLNIPLVKNTAILGIIFAIIFSTNPCALPYLGVIIASSKSYELIIQMTLFGAGLITPSILFGIFGEKILTISKKTAKTMNIVNKALSIILIIAGAYLASTITSLGRTDIWVVAIMLGLTFIIIIKAFFIINNKKEIMRIENLLLIIALAGIIIATIIHCEGIRQEADKQIIKEQGIIGLANNINNQNAPSCGNHVLDCPVCKQCLTIFGLAGITGVAGIIINHYAKKKRKKKEKKKKK